MIMEPIDWVCPTCGHVQEDELLAVSRDGAFVICHACTRSWRAWIEPDGSITSAPSGEIVLDAIHDPPVSDTERGVITVLSNPDLRNIIISNAEAMLRQRLELRSLPTTEDEDDQHHTDGSEEK